MGEPWVLCVDDDERVLRGLDLHLCTDYDLRLATRGSEGLDLLEEHPDCALIISDMRMPGMNGAQFLAAARATVPDATRILLTGFSDIEETIDAVNEGGIHRFLTKPVQSAVLRTAVAEGFRQWELVRSERVLLEQTLHGAAEALIEALEIASPDIFSRSRRIEAACRHVAGELGLEPLWEVALAGLLLRLGWISLPGDVVEKVLNGGQLTPSEVDMFDRALDVGMRLVGRIPRLEGVGRIMAEASKPGPTSTSSAVVRAAAEYDALRGSGCTVSRALKLLEAGHPDEIVSALRTWEAERDDSLTREVGVRELVEGMVVEADIVTESGTVLVKAGMGITETIANRLRNYAERQPINEPIRVS